MSLDEHYLVMPATVILYLASYQRFNALEK